MTAQEQVVHSYLTELMKIHNEQTDDKADLCNLRIATLKFLETLDYNIGTMPGAEPNRTFFGKDDPRNKITPERDTYNPPKLTPDPSIPLPLTIKHTHQQEDQLVESWKHLKEHLDKIDQATKSEACDITISLLHGDDQEIFLWEDFCPENFLELDNYREAVIRKLNKIKKEYDDL